MMEFLKNVVVCAGAGAVLAVVFLSPTGAVIGAVNGLLVGVCVGLAQKRAGQLQPAPVSAEPVRLIGSYSNPVH